MKGAIFIRQPENQRFVIRVDADIFIEVFPAGRLVVHGDYYDAAVGFWQAVAAVAPAGWMVVKEQPVLRGEKVRE